MTTPLVVDRRTGGRDATGKLAIAPRGTPGISHPPSAWRNSWCDELATLMRRPAGCRYRRRSPDCARRAARDPIEERSHSRTSGRLSRVGPIQRWMQPTQTAAGAPDAARQTGGQPGSLPRPRNLGSHAWSLSRARGFRFGRRLSRKGRDWGGCGDAGWCAGVSLSAGRAGVAVWGLVSGPGCGELVVVDLGEVLGHHQ